MITLKEPHEDGEEWRNNISKRLKRVEISILAIAVLFIGSLSYIILAYDYRTVTTNSPSLHKIEKAISSLRSSHDTMLLKIENQIPKSNRNQPEKIEEVHIASGPISPLNMPPNRIFLQKIKRRQKKKEFLSSDLKNPKPVTKSTNPPNTRSKQLSKLIHRQLQNTECKQTLFRLQLQLDDHAHQTSWELVNKQTGIVVASDKYSSKDNWEGQSSVACLSPGPYLFTIFDSAGDGICGNLSGCNRYNIFIDNSLFIRGNDFSWQSKYDFYISNDGIARERQCHKLPILSPMNHVNDFIYDNRVGKILEVIHGLSSLELLNNHYSDQYKAACWILYDDTLRISSENELLIERYALAVFLYATKQETELLLYNMNTCDYDTSVIECDRKGHIIGIRLNNFIGFSKVKVEGTIPSELSHLRNLETLDLGWNQLRGTIPPELGRLSTIKKLHLMNNRLTGTIPTEIGGQSNLVQLWLENNKLGGTIPSEIGQLIQLEQLRLDINELHGTIPLGIFNCTRLKALRLDNNNLNGTIPTYVNQLQQLEQLWLSDNINLGGKIPSEVGALSSLSQFVLDNNQLTGPIPQEIGNLDSLAVFLIHDNFFTGTLPDDIFQNFKRTQMMNLGNNKFSGTIPDSLWNLDLAPGFRTVMELQDNNFKGNVPDEFCDKVSVSVDDSRWFLDEPKVNCTCCTSANQCYFWDKTETTITCPESNIRHIDFYRRYWVRDEIADVERTWSTGVYQFESETCLSPTGCYAVEAIQEAPVLKDSYNLSYSSASNSLLIQDQCDAVNVCGNFFEANHPKRKALNQFTQLVVPDLTILQETSSPQYKALCWIMTQDALFDKYEVCDGTLLQRFVLAFFYHSQQEAFYFNDFSHKHTCHWPGVVCDSNDKFVEHINLSNRNMQRTLITEIGLLTRLQSINLSENALHGTIDPVIFAHLPYLEYFNVGHNEFGGELPQELLLYPQLRELNVSNNDLVGTLPNDIIYPESLEYFDVGNNLLQGTIPNRLLDSRRLKSIDLSRNGFMGGIPPAIGDLENLQVIRLHENRFTGSIPFNIFNPTRIEQMMLQTNMLTGSIPTQLGMLSDIRIISLNHNFLKGTIPVELASLRKLEMLHVHQNQLTGVAPEVRFRNKNQNNFIADCGLSSAMDCTSCTICCNLDGKCQNNIVWDPEIWVIPCAIASLAPFAIAIISFPFMKLRDCGFCEFLIADRDPLSIYTEDSVYCFILSKNPLAWILHLLTATVQVSLFIAFLRASDSSNEASDWEFNIDCRDNSMQCEDAKSVNIFGWVLFFVLTILHLGVDIVNSILQIQLAVERFDLQLFLSGVGLIGSSILAVFTSAYYNIALAESNTDLIVNAVILLFINDLDEKFMTVLKSMVPTWAYKQVNDIKYIMSQKCQLTIKSSKSKTSPKQNQLQLADETKIILADPLLRRSSSMTSGQSASLTPAKKTGIMGKKATAANSGRKALPVRTISRTASTLLTIRMRSKTKLMRALHLRDREARAKSPSPPKHTPGLSASARPAGRASLPATFQLLSATERPPNRVPRTKSTSPPKQIPLSGSSRPSNRVDSLSSSARPANRPKPPPQTRKRSLDSYIPPNRARKPSRGRRVSM